jgi:folate-binding protein YgfZ
MALFDLFGRTKLRLTGSDRIRFLNGQVSNDVRKANPNRSMPACVLSAKGKIEALIFVSSGEDELWIDADPEQRETLAQRLERYIIADDVAIEDVTDEFALFHATGEHAPRSAEGAHWREARRFGVPGWDLFAAAAEHDAIQRSLSAIEPFLDAEAAERLRIEQGIPRWGRELTDQIIPVEANLAADAIDYAKGCYIGQEVISRMKMSGQMSKRLCGLVSLSGSPLTPGSRLVASEEAKEVGWITSATRSERLGKEIALGYVKRGFNQPGTRLSTEEQMVEVVELPFV